MDDISLNLLVLAVFILVAAFIFWLVRKKQSAKKLEIAQMAAIEGWNVETIREPLAWGVRLKSDRWIFEALSRSDGRESGPGSSNIAMMTSWWADYPGSTILIGPRTSRVELGGMGDALVRQVLQMALGPYANGIVEVQSGNEAFRKVFMVWAQEPAEVERLLTPSLESILMSWRGVRPFIKRTTEGIGIELRGVHLENADEIRALINLGKLLIARED